MLRLDFTKPDTAKRLASLPYDGWAAAIVRKVDPLWKIEISEPRTFKVKMIEEFEAPCPHCGCDCGDNYDTRVHTVEVDACSIEEAEKLAEEQNPDWEVDRVIAPMPKIVVPPEYMALFEVETVQ
jgi:hypothetical protein